VIYGEHRDAYSSTVTVLGSGTLQTAIHVLRYVNIVAYIALGVVTLRFWHRRRDRASMWAAIAFGDLALLEIFALVPNHPGNIPERALGRVVIALIVVFPYFLFRFTNAFRKTSRPLALLLLALSTILVTWTFALPSIPQPGESRSVAFEVFVIVFFVHWATLSTVSATSLWRAGRAQPTVARRRMELLAIASGLLTLAILFAALTTREFGGFSLGAQIAGTVAVVAFFAGFAPPLVLRLLWRRPEQERVQQAMTSLLSFAASQEEVASRVLEPGAAIVGARAMAIRNAEGTVVGAWNVPSTVDTAAIPVLWPDARVVTVELVGGGSLVVWTSPFAPVFGDEELRLLQTFGALVGLALDRVRLYQAEHQARLALERADELKMSFIALAAHELRTPVTTIHGFVTTLHHLGDQLSLEKRQEVRDALIQQTNRLAALVEQLLDLSRLDAEAIEIVPEQVDIRSEVEEIVSVTAPDPRAVEIDVPRDTVALVDRNVLERVVANLVTNAFRYGVPPVKVHAERTDRHFRLTVEDVGRGVPPEFVPDLFERFARSADSRADAVGTGLGLAIARSYARAHGGDLVYEDAEPHGARFRLVLPMGS
jgi:signal transduction histidine kinase